MAHANEWKIVKAWVRRIPPKRIAIVVAVSVFATACLTIPEWRAQNLDVVDRGILFDHAFHADVGPLDCAICHNDAYEADYDFLMPDHNVCGVCHEIPFDALEFTEETDMSGCNLCHTRKDYTVDPQRRRLSEEVIWSHEPHLAAAVQCSECHVDPDRPVRRPVPDVTLKQFCMQCHEAHQEFPDDMAAHPDPAETVALAADVGMPPPAEFMNLLDCSVCHSQLDTDVIPTERGGRPLPHDNPFIWERIHGREWQVDPQFCNQCHVSEEQCDSCHSKTAPSNHTLSWRRHTHGLHATWNRQSCAVCHEEDSCVQCHQNSTPRSHRAGWDAPLHRHCVSCHMPAERTSCTVCHESIEHRRASPSPHARGFYPPNCAICHPGGLPHRAPHPMNSTTRCTDCHR